MLRTISLEGRRVTVADWFKGNEGTKRLMSVSRTAHEARHKLRIV